jgi:hypothetical protein
MCCDDVHSSTSWIEASDTCYEKLLYSGVGSSSASVGGSKRWTGRPSWD